MKKLWIKFLIFIGGKNLQKHFAKNVLLDAREKNEIAKLKYSTLEWEKKLLALKNVNPDFFRFDKTENEKEFSEKENFKDGEKGNNKKEIFF